MVIINHYANWGFYSQGKVFSLIATRIYHRRKEQKSAGEINHRWGSFTLQKMIHGILTSLSSLLPYKVFQLLGSITNLIFFFLSFFWNKKQYPNYLFQIVQVIKTQKREWDQIQGLTGTWITSYWRFSDSIYTMMHIHTYYQMSTFTTCTKNNK